MVSAAMAILLTAEYARAQEEMFDWLDPRLGRLKPRFEVRSEAMSRRKARRQGLDMGFKRGGLKFSMPLSQDKQHEWSVATKLDHLKIDSSARMPTTGEPFPADLWDVKFSTAYRRRHDNGWISAMAFRVGAAGDEPFASAGETTVGATGMLRVPSGQRNAWLYYANFSNELDELRSFPLGGVGYHWVRDKEYKLQAIIGAPVMWVSYRPTKRVVLAAVVVAPSKADAKASLHLNDELSLYTAYDWSGRKYIRHDRADDDYRMNMREQRVRLGVKWEINDVFSFDVSGGYAFDRYVYEGRGFGGSSHNRFRIDAGPFAAMRVGISF